MKTDIGETCCFCKNKHQLEKKGNLHICAKCRDKLKLVDEATMCRCGIHKD